MGLRPIRFEIKFERKKNDSQVPTNLVMIGSFFTAIYADITIYQKTVVQKVTVVKSGVVSRGSDGTEM